MVSLGDDGVITMNRGDTAKFPLFINKGTSLQPSRYELGDKDQVFLALMEPNQPFEEALLKQKYTKADLNKYGDIVITFKHDDTKCILPGKYYYQIKALLYNEEDNDFDVNTIVQKTEFYIQE